MASGLTEIALPEAQESFACFGSTCIVLVCGDAGGRTAAEAARGARAKLLDWHARFSRFDPASELSRMNADPRVTVPVSSMMARLAGAVAVAGLLTGGLVDGTLAGEIEAAGYRGELDAPALELAEALRRAPARRPAGPSPRAGWRHLELDDAGVTLSRPPGVMLDSGGIAKGLFADILAAELSAHAAYAIDCAGDIRWGGAAGSPREVGIASPFDGSIIHRFRLPAGAVATSGIGARSWVDRDGRPAHHLLDPASGRPAFTGVVQATAVASSGVAAEALAKAALLSGPDGAQPWLARGGAVVLDDGSCRISEPR